MTTNHILTVTKQQKSTQKIEATDMGDELSPSSDFVDPTALQTVQVQVEKIADRQRQITAQIQIPHSIEQVWQVLTNYEALADFIPNLSQSRRLDCPPGAIRLEQIGSQRFLRFNFSARVVLDLEESFPKTINFRMIEGDFKDFSGSWNLEPCSLDHRTGTNLCYTVKIWPKAMMPVSIIERRLSQDLQMNLLAVQQRVQQLAKVTQS
ncbi:MAG: SRPBCC family protein [Calothrix sp. MO_167.B42]|nr:SRPBCC family protein [Calothrix sp. MO_167.B42]